MVDFLRQIDALGALIAIAQYHIQPALEQGVQMGVTATWMPKLNWFAMWVNIAAFLTFSTIYIFNNFI